MLGELDEEIRETRQRLEERRHLRKCLKESVNDIRRYRRVVKVAEEEAARYDGRDTVKDPRGIAAHLKRRVAAGVLDLILAERDRLRGENDSDVAVEARWSELVVAREKRLAPLGRNLLDRLGEMEERQGVLLGQVAVAKVVQASGRVVVDDLRTLRAVLPEPDLLPDALVRAQGRLLGFRREVKHMHQEVVHLESDLQRLLGFSDALAEAWAREQALRRSPGESLQVVDQTVSLVEDLCARATLFIEKRERHARVLANDKEALPIPA